jgi:CDP-diacylglycerol--glycerol-3-phosphate 3-phosphatidyltransferase
VARTEPRPSFRPLREEITDLPNLITLARVALIPIVLLCADSYRPGLWALGGLVFVIAAASDALDGYLARRLGLVTVVGKFLDPLADKLIVLSALVMLVAKGRAPAWLVIILMGRELAVTGLRAIASQQGYVIAAGAGGKAKTALQLVGITFLLIHFEYEILLLDFVLDFHEVGIYLLYLSLVMSVLSAAEYVGFFVDAASTQAAEQAAHGLTRAGAKDRLRRRRRKLASLRKAWRRDRRQRRREARRRRERPGPSREPRR